METNPQPAARHYIGTLPGKKPTTIPLYYWPPMSARDIALVGSELCRSRTRVAIGGRQLGSSSNASGMGGRLVKLFLDKYHSIMGLRTNRGHQIPRNSDLCACANEDIFTLQLADVGTFLEGRPRKYNYEDLTNPKRPEWVALARFWLSKLLLGYDSSQVLTPEQLDLEGQICNYFFGPDDKYPKYFSPKQRASHDPYTEEEAIAGTHWLSTRLKYAGGTGIIVFTSGGPEFPQGRSWRSHGFNSHARVTLDLLKGGMDVVFIYPHPQIIGNTLASDSAKAFQSQVEEQSKPNSTRIHLVDLDPSLVHHPATGRPQWAGEFLDPTAVLTYVSHRPSPEARLSESNALYISRRLDRDELDWFPFAFLATAEEEEVFLKWCHAFCPADKLVNLSCRGYMKE